MEAAGPGSVGRSIGRARFAKPPFIVRQLAREPVEQGGEGENEVIDRGEEKESEEGESGGRGEDEGRICTEANVRPLLRP